MVSNSYPIRHIKHIQTGEVKCVLPVGGIEFLQQIVPKEHEWQWEGDIKYMELFNNVN